MVIARVGLHTLAEQGMCYEQVDRVGEGLPVWTQVLGQSQLQDCLVQEQWFS